MVIDLVPPASARSRRSVIAWRRCPSLVEEDRFSVTSAMWGSRPTGLPKRLLSASGDEGVGASGDEHGSRGSSQSVASSVTAAAELVATMALPSAKAAMRV